MQKLNKIYILKYFYRYLCFALALFFFGELQGFFKIFRGPFDLSVSTANFHLEQITAPEAGAERVFPQIILQIRDRLRDQHISHYAVSPNVEGHLLQMLGAATFPIRIVSSSECDWQVESLPTSVYDPILHETFQELKLVFRKPH